jgi:predicted MFS family arabinose efflux permease
VRLGAGLGALAERPYRLLWTARTTSAVGDAMTTIALAFAVIGIGGGASSLGLVLASMTGARIAFILVGGVWADRLPRRFVMLTSDVLRAGVEVLVGVALLAGAMELWMFVVTSAILGAAQAFFGPASTGLIAQIVGADRLQQANALLSLSQSGAFVVGPAIAGLLIAASSPGVVFLIDAATYAISALALARLPMPRLEPAPPRQRFLVDVGEGIRETWSRGWMRAGLLAAGVTNIGLAVFFVLGPIVAERELGGAAAWGAVLTAGATGGVAGGALALRFRPDRPLLACFVFWSLGVLPVAALIPPLPLLLVAGANACFALGIVYANAVWESVLQREIPPERLSRVSSFDWMVSLSFMPVGQILAGPIAGAVGTDATLAGAGVLILFATIVGFAAPSVRSRRPAARAATP